MKTKTSILASVKSFFLSFTNGWRSIDVELPSLGEQVLCYWNEYGENVQVYLVADLELQNFKLR